MQNIITDYVRICNSRVYKNGVEIYSGSEDFGTFIREIYKREEISYSPFFKMDNLSKLGFIATELLLKNTDKASIPGEQTGIVFSNSSSSLDSDFTYFDTIRDRQNYFPSPAVFVYTLPNIVTVEICIRNKFKGENMFFLSEVFDPALMSGYVDNLLESAGMEVCIGGWIELLQEKYDAFLYLTRPAKFINKNTDGTAKLHSAEILSNLFNNL
jgi:hypothetical protein